jgi:hypothetical protein
MSISRDYLSAVIPEAVVVFGVRLKPFCIGHHVILSRFESPIIDGGESSIEDLLFAVWVCGHTYEGAVESLASGVVWKELAAWRKAMRRRQWYGLRPMKLVEFMRLSKLFQEYLTAAATMPNLFTDGGGQSIGSPSIQILRIVLKRDLHLSDAEVMNRPLSLCWYDYATICELNKKGRIIDREEYAAARKRADEWTEEFLAKRTQ